jgi:hypothetical protein
MNDGYSIIFQYFSMITQILILLFNIILYISLMFLLRICQKKRIDDKVEKNINTEIIFRFSFVLILL